jgi:hypothetical protein
MSMTTVAYARRAYKSFSRSTRHIYQLIASHQSLETGWAYVGYDCLADESSLTSRRVIQLVAFLEENYALEVRRGHGRGHTNFYRLLDEETGQPVPTRTPKKVKSAPGEKVKFPTPPDAEKVKFSAPPAAEKVKSRTGNSMTSLGNPTGKIIETKIDLEEKGERIEAPPQEDTTPTETVMRLPSLSEAPHERIDLAWQPTPALEAEARTRGYYAVLGAHGIEESTIAFRDYYDGQVLRPTRWLKWVSDDARRHPDWRHYQAQRRAAAAEIPASDEEPFASHTAEEVAEVKALIDQQFKFRLP